MEVGTSVVPGIFVDNFFNIKFIYFLCNSRFSEFCEPSE